MEDNLRELARAFVTPAEFILTNWSRKFRLQISGFTFADYLKPETI